MIQLDNEGQPKVGKLINRVILKLIRRLEKTYKEQEKNRSKTRAKGARAKGTLESNGLK